MQNNVENLILEHLKNLRASQESNRYDLGEIKSRLTSLGTMVAGGRRDVVTQQEEIYRQQNGMDYLSSRIDKTERRLEIHDT